ncbi:MAG: single-stranded-DNA-specific exonuclease RecJ [Planctomycetaceae bacterium]|nr:single-stranded-DNA-specific exonuclease RecJ [Planctomycetaceae bacterium]
MPRVWRFIPHDEPRVRRLSAALGVAPLTAQVLIARGLDEPAAAKVFLSGTLHDLYPPESLPGVIEAAERISTAAKAGRRITIYGDYDVDGVTSVSLLWHCLTLLKAKVDYYIPSRLDEGYGLNCDAIRKLHAEDPSRLLVSVDCGICSVDEAALAKELGLELIITDHHSFGPTLPDAATLVHPRLPGSTYPFGELCGAGVAFKLAWAICKVMHDGRSASPRMRDFLTDAIGLAALGTVADCVPLRDENRLIVRYGLRAISTRSGPGLKALMLASGIDPKRPADAEAIGFRLAPRINAAGRLGQAGLAVELLTTDKPERAQTLADYLDTLNKERQQVERRMLKEAKELVESHPGGADAAALVLASHDWHPGVVGIVAGRVAEHYQKPAVLIGLDRTTSCGQGSARSFAGFDLHTALMACGQHLIGCGGHKAAAGLRIEASKVDTFREMFCAYVAEHHQPTESDYELLVDAEVRLADVTAAAIRELDTLGPFGQQNPRPSFVATNVELAGPPKTMGEGNRHLALLVRQHSGSPLRAVAFGRSEWAAPMADAGPLSLHFVAEINRWNGNERVELRLTDWQGATVSARD